jgi:hypothetical protein
VRQIKGVSWTVPMCVAKTCVPLGNSTGWEITKVILVKNEVQQTIWSDAPILMIQGACEREILLCVWAFKQKLILDTWRVDKGSGWVEVWAVKDVPEGSKTISWLYCVLIKPIQLLLAFLIIAVELKSIVLQEHMHLWT